MDTPSKLIADSGSTKTDWLLLKGNTRTQVRTQGINPNRLACFIADYYFHAITPNLTLMYLSYKYIVVHISSLVKLKIARAYCYLHIPVQIIILQSSSYYPFVT